MLPNFIIVGAENAGTTTLSTLLTQHPDVFMCDPKEPRFFTHHNWHKGMKWYESLFDGAGDYKAIGEASPSYTWAPEYIGVPERIHQCLGDIKYVYIVRHPIDRIISHYRHALFYGWLPEDTSFEAAIDMVPALKNCSRYFYQVEQYLQFTKQEQWHILILEELIREHQNILDRLYNFLEIRDIPIQTINPKNVSDNKSRESNIWLSKLGFLRPYLPAKIKKTGRNFVTKLGKKIEKPKITEELYCVLQDEMKPDIERLCDFSNMNLFHIWNIK